MIRKLGGFLAACLLLVNLGISAAAEEYTGSITVNMQMKEGEISLFRVGSWCQGGFLLEEQYGGGFIKEEDVFSPALAHWLAEGITGEGRVCILDEKGAAEFSRVSEGLYLLIQTKAPNGYAPMLPFLVSLPYDAQWEIQVNPKVEQVEEEVPATGQGPEPFLGVLGMILSGMGLALCCFWKKPAV